MRRAPISPSLAARARERDKGIVGREKEQALRRGGSGEREGGRVDGGDGGDGGDRGGDETWLSAGLFLRALSTCILLSPQTVDAPAASGVNQLASTAKITP